MRYAAALIAALCLAGCDAGLGDDLTGLVGQSYQVAITRLGRPLRAERTSANGPTYSWVASRQRGEAGELMPPCRVEIKTDRQGIIYDAHASGTPKSCTEFTKAMRRRR